MAYSYPQTDLIMSRSKVLFWMVFLLLTHSLCYGQDQNGRYNFDFSLGEVISLAHEQSPDALVAMHNFRASYWQYRSFKAKLLPSLSLSGTIGNYNRSIIDLQNSETGEIRYITNDNMRNRLSLSIDQSIALTGGILSINTDLSRIDQYAPQSNTLYSSQPFNVTYIQPLLGYNSLKWEKKISPQEYEQAKRTYLETMEDITLRATQYYFDMLLAQQRLELAKKNYANTEEMYRITEERFKIGSVTQSDLLQLELRLLNDELSISTEQMTLDYAMFSLRSFLGYNDVVVISLIAPEGVPDLTLDYDEVLRHTYDNSAFSLSQDLLILSAERSVAQARANRGISLTFNAQFGLTQQGGTFSDSYRHPMDKEIISLGVRLPIIDWGQGKGRVKMAMSYEEVVRAQVEQAHIRQRQNILMNVTEFNNQKFQCARAAKADTVAQERYRVTLDRFANGTLGVIELNTAQSEKDDAVIRYISELRKFWTAYYTIRKQSLYDYITNTNISAEFDRIIDN